MGNKTVTESWPILMILKINFGKRKSSFDK